MMLSRGLSNASNRSSQPKSLAFVQAHPLAPQEHHERDIETAHKQAIAAASFAFERASERALAAQGLKESSVGQAAGTEGQVETGQHLGRKQSIRFTGLTAFPIRNRSITRRYAPELNDMSSLPNGGQDRSHTTGGYFPDHRVSGPRNSPRSKGDAYGTRVSSSSASYRKLQRARSMFSLRGSATNLFSDNRTRKNSKVQQKSANSTNEHGQLSDVTDSRIQRSFSFLRGEKDHMASGLDIQKNKSAVAKLAREQYLRELEEKKLKVDSSPLAAGHNHKSQRAFRKSVRSSSTNSYGSAIASPAQVPKESALKKGLGYKARSLSFSLKQKLKHVFQRSSDSKETIPIQQLDASRPHFGEYTSTFAGVDQEYHQIPSPDSEILRKARSRESSLGKVPGFPESASPAKSIRSVRSEDEASPLFASWANPTPGNILATTQSREKKRLSVIQEHGGPHQPSSSGHNYTDLSNVFHTPIRSSSTGTQIEAFVDSQKMYSALQQKINENRRLAQPEDYSWEKERNDDGAEANTSKLRRASLSSQPFTNIPVEDASPDHGTETSNLVMVEPIRTSSMINEIHPTQDRSKDYSIQEELLEMYTSLTPQQIAAHNESNDIFPKRPLRDIKAAFFPSSMRIERTNISPYRQLMDSGGENEAGAGSEVEENTSARVRSESAFGSASIYSRTSSGNTPKDNKSSVSLTKSDTSHERGQTIVITNLQRPHEESLAPLTRQSEFPKKSKDRQGWMESELSQLGNRGLGNIQDFSTAGKENRHKRESAQIDDDDIEMGRLREEAHMKKQAFGILLEKAISQPNLRNQALGSMFTRSPLLEIGQSVTLERSEQSSPSPPCHPSTPRKSLYLDHEMSSSRRRNQGSDVPGRTGSHGTPKSQGSDPLGNRDAYMLRHSLSTSTENMRMDTTQDMRGTPTPAPIRAVFRMNKAAKSQGYNSPERIARVRRLRSSNSLAYHNKCQVEPNTGEHESGQDNKEIIGSAFRNPPTSEGVPNHNVSSTAFVEARPTGVRSMVDSFLSTRRRNTGVSQDNNMGPAFL